MLALDPRATLWQCAAGAVTGPPQAEAHVMAATTQRECDMPNAGSEVPKHSQPSTTSGVQQRLLPCELLPPG